MWENPRPAKCSTNWVAHTVSLFMYMCVLVCICVSRSEAFDCFPHTFFFLVRMCCHHLTFCCAAKYHSFVACSRISNAIIRELQYPFGWSNAEMTLTNCEFVEKFVAPCRTSTIFAWPVHFILIPLVVPSRMFGLTLSAWLHDRYMRRTFILPTHYVLNSYYIMCICSIIRVLEDMRKSIRFYAKLWTTFGRCSRFPWSFIIHFTTEMLKPGPFYSRWVCICVCRFLSVMRPKLSVLRQQTRYFIDSEWQWRWRWRYILIEYIDPLNGLYQFIILLWVVFFSLLPSGRWMLSYELHSGCHSMVESRIFGQLSKHVAALFPVSTVIERIVLKQIKENAKNKKTNVLRWIQAFRMTTVTALKSEYRQLRYDHSDANGHIARKFFVFLFFLFHMLCTHSTVRINWRRLVAKNIASTTLPYYWLTVAELKRNS